MATLVLGAAGAAIGGSLGGSVLGLSAAVIGRAAGATVGRMIDQRILGTGAQAVEHGRIDRFRLTGASEGAAIPRVVGRVRLGGQVIWATRFREMRTVSGGGGGKGAAPSAQTTSFSYSVSLALALCEGEITRVGRIWADGSEIARNSLNLRVYHGREDQLPDALIEAVEGHEAAPAFRGTAYVVIEDLDLAPFGNRVPQLSFEVVRAAVADGQVGGMSDVVQGVALVPGTGEYALSTTSVHYEQGGGARDSANVSTIQDTSDFNVSIRDLAEEMPNVGAASLVVSWFGNDLRCGHCQLRPLAEQAEAEGVPHTWRVSGLDRATAGAVPVLEDRPVYGGTPSDISVVEAIRDLTTRGIDVTFYPFILMTQLAQNGLPDPWGAEEQAVLPWRGRITTEQAPGQPGTTDRTGSADGEVAAFFGAATADDFSVEDGAVVYSGPEEFSYRRFILHYAALCAAAGGVEAFCIGSEMRSLTRIRGAGDTFPAVAALVELAREVRRLLPAAKLGYAADWSEYYGYHPADTGAVHFHLDPLWSAEEIDFVGIDNYMPLSDWRDGDDHLDAKYRSIQNLEYLKDNIEGGEGFDWYYPTPEARASQRRVAIEDGAYGEPWVYRYKDLKAWWENAHHERGPDGRSAVPTAWEPRSKPIRFTEYGCAAVDKGTNQPNKFLDPKSSESSLPHFSNGRRDDALQMQYLRAMNDHWTDIANNPRSESYGGPMIDMAHSFAWAWDTRPWPAFPDLLSFWSDGVNYQRGHWINGRSAGQPLATVIAEICMRHGLTDFDVSEVYGVVRGYVAQDVQTGRADLQPLMLAYGIDAVEREGKLCFFMRANAKEWRVASEDMVREKDAVVSYQRSPDAEVSGRVRVSHIDAAGGFETRVGDAVRPGEGVLPVAESELPLSLTAGEGHALAERFLSESLVARDTLRVSLPPSNRSVQLGDHISLDVGSDRWRVDRVEDVGHRRLEAVRVEKSVFEPSDAVEDGAGAVRPLAALPVQAVFLDLPLLTGNEVPHAPYLAISARPWPGSVAAYASVEDAGYRLNTIIDGPSVIGRTQTVLEAATPAIWDRGPELIVEMQGGSLSGVSDLALLSGANALAIGNGSISGWEILQFRDVRLIDNGVWGLSMRLRGQRGTDSVMPVSWPIGSIVVLLDGAIDQIDLTTDAVGLERHYRIGPARLPLDHESYVYRTAVAGAEGLRPYAPAHFRVRQHAGEYRFDWIRRSRAVGEAWGAADVALAEATEAYRLRLLRLDGTVAFETETPTASLSISAAEFASLGFGEAGGTATVAQLSDTYGAGHESTVTF
ncbi:glycoside hydrolase/phage tail family protein [Jannaschia sp. 2305UL9-9]|uniref:baseplate multidomain protein megatron n=1 Tax=Jannaschia sp. 2305UL9-9 TaxID=3121638 RepID=UPI003527DC81